MSLVGLLEPVNFLGTRPSNLNVSNAEKSTAATQRNQTTTSTRFRVGQFHHFGHRSATVHGDPHLALSAIENENLRDCTGPKPDVRTRRQFDGVGAMSFGAVL